MCSAAGSQDALSNIGSLLALLSYPFWFERWFDLDHQALYWSFGFVLYAALAVGVSRALPTKFSNAPARSVVTVAPLLVVALVNVTGQFAEAGVLAATRGNGLFSDAINRFADDLNRAARKPSVFTPDWGLALPIVFLTHGDVPVDSIEDFGKAKHALCSGRDVALALIEGDRAVRRALWERALDWKADAVVAYRQAHGEVVFDLATFSGDTRAPSCSAAVSPVACGRDCSAPAAR